MADKTIILSKDPSQLCQEIPLIEGDNNTYVIRFVAPRYSGGVDLSNLAWGINIKNSTLEQGYVNLTPVDPSEQSFSTVTSDEVAVYIEWNVGAFATVLHGTTFCTLEGRSNNPNDDARPVWKSSMITLKIGRAISADDIIDDDMADAITEIAETVAGSIVGNSVRYDTTQSLNSTQKTTARTNIDALAEEDLDDIVVVSEEEPQTEITQIWINPDFEEIQVPSYAEYSELKNEFDNYRESTQMIFSGNGSTANKFDYAVIKGQKYLVTNGTSGNISLNVYNNGEATQILSSLASGATTWFVADDDYDQIGGYFNQSGNITVSGTGFNDVYNTDVNTTNHDIVNANSGDSNLGLYSTFDRGNLYNGNINKAYMYRVRSNDIITIDHEVIVSPNSGFRFSLDLYNDGTFARSTGWQTSFYIIPANQQFRIIIGRTPEDNTEIADIDYFVKQVTFRTVIGSTLDYMARTIGFVEQAVSTKFAWAALSSASTRNIVSSGNTVSFEAASTNKFGVYSAGAVFKFVAGTEYSYKAHISMSDKTTPMELTYTGRRVNETITFIGETDIVIEGLLLSADASMVFYITGQAVGTVATVSDIEVVYGNRFLPFSAFTITKSADINDNVIGINHRGYKTEAPENTIPAYILSKQNGFKYVETDVRFTSDGVPVLLHDATIDRTSNGTGNIADMTYAQALTYDFGSWYSSAYAGTKIPTFEEYIVLCRNIGLHPYVELKVGTAAQIQGLVDIVIRNGMRDKVTWICYYTELLNYVKAYDDTMRIGLLSETITETTITNAQGLKTDHNDVFIASNYNNMTTEIVNLCIAARIPLEAYAVNSSGKIRNLDPYVTGVLSDLYIVGYEIFKGFIN